MDGWTLSWKLYPNICCALVLQHTYWVNGTSKLKPRTHCLMTYSNFYILLSSGFTAVVELDSQSKKYRDLCKKFQKDWAKEKGQCPSVIAIVRIVNPMIAERFESFRSKLPVLFQRTEKHYHGTTLCCDLAEYAELCNGLSVCLSLCLASKY